MSTDTSPQFDDTRALKNVRVLVFAQAVLGAQMPINFVLGGLAGQVLASNKCFATLPISVIVFCSMLSAPVLANIMQAQGRRTGFVIGCIAAAIGACLSATALIIGSFTLLLVGSALTGIYMAAQQFFRFAATDNASPQLRPKAISWVMAGGLGAAVIGPQLVKVTQGALDPIPYAGGYLAIVALNVIGVWIFALLNIPKPTDKERDLTGARTRMELLKTPRIAVAMICAMVSYALMNLVMTSTPLAIVGCGFTTNNAADVVMAHVLAMFIPSFFTGHLIQRFGVERIIAVGLGFLLLAGLVGLSGTSLWHFNIALILLGFGWNFGFIGATAMLASAHAPNERARAQGMNDFAVFGLVTIASLSSGGLMNCMGGDAVQGWNAVNFAMGPFLAVAGGALIWYLLTKAKHEAAPV